MKLWASGRKDAAAKKPAPSRSSPPWPTWRKVMPWSTWTTASASTGVWSSSRWAAKSTTFWRLEYQGGDRLYLPVDRLNLVQKYLGVEGASPRVARLGGKSWERAKTRVKKAVEKIARELVELYALRRVLPGHHFSPPDPTYREFEATFEYEETPDQLAAVADVLADMMSDEPMDRLICGDVGYGKTEVAVRAAFKAAMDGKQVAVLVPTTVLAEQHYETFRRRLAHFPLEVRALSRFRGAMRSRSASWRTWPRGKSTS